MSVIAPARGGRRGSDEVERDGFFRSSRRAGCLDLRTTDPERSRRFDLD